MVDSILDAVGSTPMIRLKRIAGADDADILVKYEGLNVGGSIKTRSALNMIAAAEREGMLREDSVIVEPSSGNQGIAIALIGAAKGYKVKIVMPDSVSEERRKLIMQYGAEVILVRDEGNIGECIENCLKIVSQLAEDDPRVFIPQQFKNPRNPEIHRNQTAVEIIEQAGGPIHGFCSGIGTGGTISGVGEVLRKHYSDITIWAVEPENAAILSGGPIGTHLQMGIGDGLIPEVLNTEIYDDICVVSDDEALRTAKDLARLEGLMCGISSGSNVFAAIRLAKRLGKGRTVVTILPDTGERYFSTRLFESVQQ